VYTNNSPIRTQAEQQEALRNEVKARAARYRLPPTEKQRQIGSLTILIGCGLLAAGLGMISTSVAIWLRTFLS
jgi:hypothetical protein